MWEIKTTEKKESTCFHHLIEVFPEIKKLLKIKTNDDLHFCIELQLLHDVLLNWDEDFLNLFKVEKFAQKHKLEVPKSI